MMEQKRRGTRHRNKLNAGFKTILLCTYCVNIETEIKEEEELSKNMVHACSVTQKSYVMSMYV